MNYSRQREAILNELRSRRDHPTADMVYEAVKKDFPTISLGTVYRNLSLLADLGEILELSEGDGPKHYDGFTDDHDHFVCTNCGKIIDIDSSDSQSLMPKAKGIGRVESRVITYKGLCEACM